MKIKKEKVIHQLTTIVRELSFMSDSKFEECFKDNKMRLQRDGFSKKDNKMRFQRGGFSKSDQFSIEIIVTKMEPL